MNLIKILLSILLLGIITSITYSKNKGDDVKIIEPFEPSNPNLQLQR